MITIYQPELEDDYLLFEFNCFCNSSCLWALALPKNTSCPKVKLDSRYLKQGGAMDKFDNKSVAHFELDGDVELAAVSDDSEAVFTLPRARTWVGPLPYGDREETRQLFRNGQSKAFVRLISCRPSGDWSYEWANRQGAVWRYSVRWMPNGKGGYNIYIRSRLVSVVPEWKALDFTWAEAWSKSGSYWQSTYYKYDAWRNTSIIERDGSYYSSTIEDREEHSYHLNPDRDYHRYATTSPSDLSNDYTPSSLKRGWWANFRPTSFRSIPKSRWRQLYDFTRDHVDASVINDVSMNSRWSELMANAISSMKNIDTNIVTTLADFKNLATDVTNWCEAIKDLAKNPKLKSFADVYLSTKYGYGMTLTDAKAIGSAFASGCPFGLNPHCTVKSTESVSWDSPPHYYRNVKTRYNYSCTVSSLPGAFSNAYNALRKNSLWITATDMWDMIPLSFVIDWFLGVGDLIESIDLKAQTYNLDLETVVKSTKTEGQLLVGVALPEISGNVLHAEDTFVDFKRYHRWVESSFDPVPLLPRDGPCPWLEVFQKHWPELGSLIIQRIK